MSLNMKFKAGFGCVRYTCVQEPEGDMQLLVNKEAGSQLNEKLTYLASTKRQKASIDDSSGEARLSDGMRIVRIID